MYLDINLKMLMTKMGVTPSSSLPSDTPLPSNTKNDSAERITGHKESGVVQDLDGNFKMTEEVFDSVMEDYSWARGASRQDNKRKVPALQDSTEVGNEDL